MSFSTLLLWLVFWGLSGYAKDACLNPGNNRPKAGTESLIYSAAGLTVRVIQDKDQMNICIYIYYTSEEFL